MAEISSSEQLLCAECGQMYNQTALQDGSQTYSSEYCIDPCRVCRQVDWNKDTGSGTIVCNICGTVKEDLFISGEKDWNNYTDDRKSGQDNSRVGWTDVTNPENTLGTQIIKSELGTVECVDPETGIVHKRNLHLIQQHISYSNAEQAYNRVINDLNKYVPDHINKRILAHAVYIWSHIKKNGQTYRGDIRKGILGNCIYFACLEIGGCHRKKSSIKRFMNISDDSFQNGEKILGSFYVPSVAEEDLSPSSIFSNIINEFNEKSMKNSYDKGLFPYEKFVPKCIKVYNQCKDDSLSPEIVSLDTAVAGVVYYVFKKTIPSSIPPIHQMNKILGVTNPTMRKAYKRIVEQLS